MIFREGSNPQQETLAQRALSRVRALGYQNGTDKAAADRFTNHLSP